MILLVVVADDVAEWLSADGASAIVPAPFCLLQPAVTLRRPLAYFARLLPWQCEEQSRPRAGASLPGINYLICKN